ncbi:prophage P2 OGR-like protein [Escherichia coli]|uniref:Prophage P2 OGR-like protein n=1 Tax=Escherichia coli TaxID=562 RepID=A0A2X1IYI4_ECOLX|nr:prophage P2 OGR-like protein [Escherichia coli]
MMICPLCGSAAHTRSSFQVSSLTKERYNQCQNINCSHTFVTHETFVRSIATPKRVKSGSAASNEIRTGGALSLTLPPLCRHR